MSASISRMNNEYPFSERYRVAGEKWVELEAKAQFLEDSKSAIMAQKQAELGDIPVNKAEQTVKASPDWLEHIQAIVDARKAANLAKIRLDVAKMEFYESQSREASARAEMRMLGDTT